MRADTLVKIVTLGKMEYDYATGDHVQGESSIDEVYAYVSDTGTERMSVLYAGIKENALTVRLNQLYRKPFDHVEINGKQYTLDMRRHYRHKTVIEVSGR